MSPTTTPETTLLQAARILAQARGQYAVLKVTVHLMSRDGTRVEESIRPGPREHLLSSEPATDMARPTMPVAVQTQPVPHLAEESCHPDDLDLSPDLKSRILRVLAETDKPLKVTTIAKRLERRCTSHFRNAVKHLLLAKSIRRLDGHVYWRADRPVPASNRPTGATSQRQLHDQFVREGRETVAPPPSTATTPAPTPNFAQLALDHDDDTDDLHDLDDDDNE